MDTDERPLRVVWYSPTERGGHPSYVRTLLKEADLPVIWLAGRRVCADSLPEPVEVVRLWGSIYRDDGCQTVRGPFARAMVLVLREVSAVLWVICHVRSIAAVHLQEVNSPAWAVCFAILSRLGVRTCITVHNVREHESSRIAAMRSRVVRATARQAYHVLVHDAAAANVVASEWRISRTVTSVGHFVWPVGESDEGSGQGDGFELPDRPHALVFGVIRANKGISLLLQAMSLMKHRLSVAVVGSCRPELRRMYRLEAERLDLCDRVWFDFRFVPESEISSVFGRAMYLVLPYTEFHAQSGVLHLGIAHGVPQIVTDVGGLGEVVREYGTGVACDASSEALADALDALTGDAELRSVLARNCARAGMELHPSRIWQRHKAIYAGAGS